VAKRQRCRETVVLRRTLRRVTDAGPKGRCHPGSVSGAHPLTLPIDYALVTGASPPCGLGPSPGAHLRVLLADIPGAGRRAIAALLRSLPGVVLVAEVGSAEELARERPRNAPDVVIVDDRLLAAAVPYLGSGDVPVIVVGLDDDPSFASRARRLGASAWIPKEHSDDQLPDALDRARHRLSSPAAWADATA
jgi:CheY-like chemotaxis protein